MSSTQPGRAPATPPARRGRTSLARILPRGVGLLGIVDVISAVTKPERYRLDTLSEILPLEVIRAAVR